MLAWLLKTFMIDCLTPKYWVAKPNQCLKAKLIKKAITIFGVVSNQLKVSGQDLGRSEIKPVSQAYLGIIQKLRQSILEIF